MPEGPEIRRAADRIGNVLINAPLRKVFFGLPKLQHLAEPLADSKIVDVRTKGKALLTDFANGYTVYSHNQLYGKWYVVKTGERPKTNRQLRWLLETDQHSALLYSASDIDVLRTDELASHPFLARAGLDVLSDDPSSQDILDHILAPRFAKRALGGLLLDQSFIAGVGNYLRSEILFCAKLSADARIGTLTEKEVERLANCIQSMIERAYRTGGITNDPDKVKELKEAGWRRSRYRHFVFARANQACHQCDSTIEKTTVASRRLYYCPSCQEH